MLKPEQTNKHMLLYTEQGREFGMTVQSKISTKCVDGHIVHKHLADNLDILA